MLRPALVAAIDFRALRVENVGLVSAALRSRHSDPVLSAEVHGRRMFFHAIFEHQRDVEALMIVRMGIYMMRVWEHVITDDPRRTDAGAGADTDADADAGAARSRIQIPAWAARSKRRPRPCDAGTAARPASRGARSPASCSAASCAGSASPWPSKCRTPRGT